MRSVKMDWCLISILVESVSTNLVFNFKIGNKKAMRCAHIED